MGIVSVMGRRLRFSVVTPSLNQGRFIRDCLDSVIAQDWPDVEHFVIDGGSTDETLAVLQQYAGRLTGFVSERDNGAADALNKGLIRCTGDIVAWLNADDFYLPGTFATVAAAFTDNPGASFIFGNGLRVDEAGRRKALFNPHRPLFNRRALVEGLDYILQPSTFMNPKILRQAGYLNTELRYSFDWDLWIRMADLAPPAAIDATLSASREYEQTLTGSGGFRRAEELRKLAERFSGRQMSHGALCYYLDTLLSALRNSGDLRNVEPALLALWERVQVDMQRLGVDPGGMPVSEKPLDEGGPLPRPQPAAGAIEDRQPWWQVGWRRTLTSRLLRRR